jgi:hypothetical protein
MVFSVDGKRGLGHLQRMTNSDLINAPKIKCECGMIAKGVIILLNHNRGVKVEGKIWHHRKCPKCGTLNLLGEHIFKK